MERQELKPKRYRDWKGLSSLVAKSVQEMFLSAPSGRRRCLSNRQYKAVRYSPNESQAPAILAFLLVEFIQSQMALCGIWRVFHLWHSHLADGVEGILQIGWPKSNIRSKVARIQLDAWLHYLPVNLRWAIASRFAERGIRSQSWRLVAHTKCSLVIFASSPVRKK